MIEYLFYSIYEHDVGLQSVQVHIASDFCDRCDTPSIASVDDSIYDGSLLRS